MKFEQKFSVPIIFDRLERFTESNRELKTWILELEKDENQRNQIATQKQRKDLFESQWDLLERDNQAIQQLKNELFHRLIFIIGKLNRYDQKIIESLQINQQTWFHVTRQGGFFNSHNHPMASWSSVYCVDDGDTNQDPESAITKFAHPAPMTNCYIDAGNAALVSPFHSGDLNVKLKTGDVVFFPSYLMHQVTPYTGAGARITIASNYWIDSKLIGVRV